LLRIPAEIATEKKKYKTIQKLFRVRIEIATKYPQPERGIHPNKN